MSLTEDDLNEFRAQGEDFLKITEQSLGALGRGEVLALHYDAIFRAFHGIRGSASMLGMKELEDHMIGLDHDLRRHRGDLTMSPEVIKHLRDGADVARKLLGGPVTAFRFDAEPGLLQPEGRVLVIDDEPDLVELLSHILIASNMEVQGTSDPERVAELIESFQPDAVVTDISMPKMTGMDILDLVHRTRPDLPVVFVSGHVDKDALLAAIDLGVFAVIEKPFDVVRVVETSRNAVRKHKLVKLLNRSINLIAYNFPEIDQVLTTQGKDDLRRAIKHELDVLIEGRRHLRSRTTAER